LHAEPGCRTNAADALRCAESISAATTVALQLPCAAVALLAQSVLGSWSAADAWGTKRLCHGEPSASCHGEPSASVVGNQARLSCDAEVLPARASRGRWHRRSGCRAPEPPGPPRPKQRADVSCPQVRARQVWGSDIYTEDSDIVAVLMHTGYYSIALQVGGRPALRAPLAPGPVVACGLSGMPLHPACLRRTVPCACGQCS
jgi:Histone deacetylation protein Rxt3